MKRPHECLDIALKYFRSEQEMRKTCAFSIAKCLLEKANLLLEPTLEEGAAQNYFSAKQNVIEECLDEAIKWLNIVKNDISRHSMLLSLENLKMNKFFAKCYLMQAKLQKNVGNVNGALSHITDAIAELESSKPKIKPGESPAAINDMQEGPKDRNLMSECIQVKNSITHVMRSKISNLFTFARACPLVEVT